jgi:hypothetical protein
MGGEVEVLGQNKLPAEVFWARGRSFAQNFVFAERNFPLKFVFSTCIRGAEHSCVRLQ